MRDLFLALFAEGSTDDRFLPTLIERLAEEIVAGSKEEMVQVHPTLILNNLMEAKLTGGAEQILEAARLASNCHILIVHSDADNLSAEVRKEYNFDPGVARVAQAVGRGEKVCSHLLPLIPVRMMENWILADLECLLNDVLSSGMKPSDLKLPQEIRLPTRTREIQSHVNPKATLRSIIAAASSRPRMDIGEIYEPMARAVRLERLRRLSAFQRFESDLKAKLRELNICQF